MKDPLAEAPPGATVNKCVWMYLSPDTMRRLIPPIEREIEDDFDGGRVLSELIDLRNRLEAHLTHEGDI